MKRNILSLGQLLQKGYSIHMKNHSPFYKRWQKKLNYEGEIVKK